MLLLFIIALQRHPSEWDVDAYALFHWAEPDEDLHGIRNSVDAYVLFHWAKPDEDLHGIPRSM